MQGRHLCEDSRSRFLLGKGDHEGKEAIMMVQETQPREALGAASVSSVLSRWSSDQALFRKEGEYWTVGYGGSIFRLKDTKGLAYLAQQLRHPGTEFHALDLVGGTVDRSSVRTSQGLPPRRILNFQLSVRRRVPRRASSSSTANGMSLRMLACLCSSAARWRSIPTAGSWWAPTLGLVTPRFAWMSLRETMSWLSRVTGRCRRHGRTSRREKRRSFRSLSLSSSLRGRPSPHDKERYRLFPRSPSRTACRQTGEEKGSFILDT